MGWYALIGGGEAQFVDVKHPVNGACLEVPPWPAVWQLMHVLSPVTAIVPAV
jgi:hypothetical protein